MQQSPSCSAPPAAETDPAAIAADLRAAAEVTDPAVLGPRIAAAKEATGLPWRDLADELGMRHPRPWRLARHGAVTPLAGREATH